MDGGAWWAAVHGVAKLLGLLSHCSHVQLWDPIDGSPPGSSVHGILQARALEWGAIAFYHMSQQFHSREMKTSVPAKDLCVITEALSVTVKIWKQPQMPVSG